MGKKKAKARRAMTLDARLDRLTTLHRELDLVCAIGELDALRLQMFMDRRAKMFEALSNISKKMAKQQAAIVRALK